MTLLAYAVICDHGPQNIVKVSGLTHSHRLAIHAFKHPSGLEGAESKTTPDRKTVHRVSERDEADRQADGQAGRQTDRTDVQNEADCEPNG